jgi:diguanylate cyclase (GGDEF)-like protein
LTIPPVIERAASADDSSTELLLYQRYLDALSRITLLLLENTSEENWTEVLRLLVETTDVSQCCLFLNDADAHDSPAARLASTWSAAGASMLNRHDAFRRISFQDYPGLGDKLHVGMVLAAAVADLPGAEHELFRQVGIGNVLCIPLLMRGEMSGFLGLFCEDPVRAWRPAEIKLLCTIANDLSLALVRRNAERGLRATEARLKALIGATEDLVIEYDEHQTIHNVWTENMAVLALLPNEPRGRSIAALPQELGRGLMSAASQVLLSGGHYHAEFTLPFPDGPRHFLARVQLLPTTVETARHIVALLRDVTQVRQEETKRKAMLETLNLLEEAIIDLDPSGNLVSASVAWVKLCGASRTIARSYLGPLLQYVQSDDHAMLLASFAELAAGERKLATLRFRMLQEDNEQIWVECRLLAISGADGRIFSLRGILRDITAVYLQERRITQLALHDALTQLPNRVLLEDHLHQAIARAQRNNGKIALGFIDLDHFKQINDTLGHKAGDTVLLTLSRRLAATLREVDTLSRWGGDEFVVLLTDSNSDDDFRRIAERLREVARQSIDIDGIEAQLTISVGFAVYPDDAEDAETLMSLADHTMFHAKSIGRNNVQFFHDIRGTVLKRENVLLQTRLAQAIAARELQVFYQPVVDARSSRIVGLEALARWHDDQEGWVPPDVFIPMAEHLGLIHDLGEQIIDHALERLKAWRRDGYNVTAAINLSRAQLFAPNFQERLLGKLESCGLRPQNLVLEITESVALLDVSYESKRLNELAAAGFSLAIDDFGTGYSGLAQLHAMPIDTLKVDASFTARLNTEDGRRIVQAIVQMAHALKLETIVEGVEAKDDVRYLISLDVTHMQGRHFGEPMPAGVIDMLLAQQAAEMA